VIEAKALASDERDEKRKWKSKPTEPLLRLVGGTLDDFENTGLERFDRRNVVGETISIRHRNEY
jgi:hypothetical protein